MTPTQRTLKAMRELGRISGIVERFNQFAGPHGVRQDLFGFIDIICIDPKDGIIGVQSCGQSFSGHVKKMTEERHDVMVAWLRHAKIELWGWRKVHLKRGSTAERWRPRVMDFWLEEGILIWKERKEDNNA